MVVVVIRIVGDRYVCENNNPFFFDSDLNALAWLSRQTCRPFGIFVRKLCPSNPSTFSHSSSCPLNITSHLILVIYNYLWSYE